MAVCGRRRGRDASPGGAGRVEAGPSDPAGRRVSGWGGRRGGLILDRDNETEDLAPVWSGVVRVDGEPVVAELLPEGDGYELCATPSGAPPSRCVEVTDSNGIDARLEPTSTMDLLIVLSGSDRPLDFADGVEVPFGSRDVHGALVAVDTAGDCVSFSVPDPTGGTSHMTVSRTVHDARGCRRSTTGTVSPVIGSTDVGRAGSGSVVVLGEADGGVGGTPGAGFAVVGVEAADVAPAAVVLDVFSGDAGGDAVGGEPGAG